MPDPFISSDAASIEYQRETLKQAVKGNRREQLEAIRDYIAHELEANLCNTCANSRLRTGDQASLILRLQTVLAEIDALPKADGEESRLDNIRRLGIAGGASTHGRTDPPTQPGSVNPLDQRRTGSRKPGGGRRAGT